MKNKFTFLFIISLFTLMYSSGYAQDKVVKGKITDSSGFPLPGANIIIKGTQKGTSTDSDGKYSINVSSGDILVYTFTGSKKEERTVSESTVYNIILKDDSNLLEEVVVVGYGMQKKNDVTGAMISVSAEQLKSRPVNNVIEAMQGKAAGVDITSNERPGTVGSITIRGVRSLTASNSPLYVVDGIPTGGIDNLNSNDIQSIDILKDASATAIYGSRGANGVVIITTKRGKAGKMSLDFSSSLTVENLQDDNKIMNAGEYIEWRRWAKYYANPLVFPRGDQPTNANDFIIFLGSGDPAAWANIQKGWASGTWDGSKVTTTNWMDLVTRTGISKQYNLSASGGTENMNGYLSFGYLDNEGTVKGQGYGRYTMKGSFDVTPKKWFSFGGSINASYSKNEYGQSTVGGNSVVNNIGGLYDAARSIFSYAVPYDSAGNRVEFPGGDIAVKTIVDEEKYSQDQRLSYRTTGSLYTQIDFGSFSPILKGLKYRMNFGPDFNMYRDGVYIDSKSVVRSGSSFASLTKNQTFTYTLDNLLYYDKTIGKHSFGATLLQSQSQYQFETNSMSADGIPFSSQKWNALSSSNVALNGWNSGMTENQLMSYMARLNYSFDGKYLLTVSGRSDGASQLSPEYKWAFFPSAALGWRIDKEDFLSNTSWINQLKVRFGVGVTGNAAIDAYATKEGLVPLFYPYGATVTPGSRPPTTLANQQVGWEKTTQYNIGIDFSVFKGRISGILDMYKSQTKDLLLKRSIPSVTGYIDTYDNIGETANKGIDLTLNTINVRTNKFQWDTSLSASWQEDHIVSLANGKQNDINNGWFINQPLGEIYSYASNGIWKEEDAAEMALFNANGHKFQAGMSRPVDQNGDHKIDANNDRVFIGNTRPKYTVGLTNTFTYNNIELSILLYGRMGYTYNTGGEGQAGRFNQRSINYYTENNKNSEYQKPIYSEGTGDAYSLILGYKNGSYLKVRNISLGYNIPKELAQKIGISNMKIYMQATNPGMLFRKVDWIDLDLGSSSWNRGITTGINVSF
ncbi:SusC/RagA family TonB-linked outer membrane protein [Flavobacterium gawalongense]|uniref:TonB-dependent receptor n=1 Tax=Flavobacterium gawalongense TaxID=2594432 RepID=A0ABY3CPI6_9FLAO|nr:TonB-dependent receptor [Flavobacterium gawalongense]TRX03760.1 TonB-dependent receptor [Flavobacterium gawalongense]TRX08908.1 TonB-dependent receptor [Flavobacterium gawalongense]